VKPPAWTADLVLDQLRVCWDWAVLLRCSTLHILQLLLLRLQHAGALQAVHMLRSLHLAW
jgi:hypothetical protein